MKNDLVTFDTNLPCWPWSTYLLILPPKLPSRVVYRAVNLRFLQFILAVGNQLSTFCCFRSQKSSREWLKSPMISIIYFCYEVGRVWLFQLGRFPVPFPLTWHLYFFILALGIPDYIQLEKLMNCIFLCYFCFQYWIVTSCFINFGYFWWPFLIYSSFLKSCLAFCVFTVQLGHTYIVLLWFIGLFG